LQQLIENKEGKRLDTTTGKLTLNGLLEASSEEEKG
jgi:hypothetical protein